MLDAIRRRLATLIDPEKRSLGLSPTSDPGFWGGFFGRQSHAGVAITPVTAIGIPAFWRSVNIIASTIAATSLEVSRKNKRGGSSPALEHDAYDMLHAKPNKVIPRFQFWQTLISHALIYKGGYAEIEWSTRNRPMGLHLMDPRNTRAILNKDRTVEYQIDQSGKKIDSADVIHIRGLGFNGIEGYSLVDIATDTFGVARAQLVHESSVFGNGAFMGGHVEMPGSMTETQKNEFRTNWNAVHQGPSNAAKTGILTGGMKWVPTNFSPVDADLMQAREFAVKEFSRLTGIPPHMLGLMEGATVGNAEQQALQFVKFVLMPWFRSIEGELEIKLFSPQERKTYCIIHDTNTLERGDSSSRTARYKGLFDMGAMSPNQVMLSEGIEPIDDPRFDYHFIPANNLQALETWDADPTQPASSKPDPSEKPDDAKDPDDEESEGGTGDSSGES